MLTDVVVDTNIFLHAQNPNEKRFVAAKQFLTSLLEANTKLCVDGVFDIQAPHRSLIAHEYLSHIPPTGLGYAVLVQLLQSGRVKMNVSTKVTANLRKFTVSLIPHDSRDRTFVFVATNSDSHIIVSHDWVDFTADVRQKVQKRLGVIIEEASETVARFSKIDD